MSGLATMGWGDAPTDDMDFTIAHVLSEVRPEHGNFDTEAMSMCGVPAPWLFASVWNPESVRDWLARPCCACFAMYDGVDMEDTTDEDLL